MLGTNSPGPVYAKAIPAVGTAAPNRRRRDDANICRDITAVWRTGMHATVLQIRYSVPISTFYDVCKVCRLVLQLFKLKLLICY